MGNFAHGLSDGLLGLGLGPFSGTHVDPFIGFTPHRLPRATGENFDPGEGLSDVEIAGRLEMAEATVKTHVSRLPGKPGLHSRAQAAVLVPKLGIQPKPGAVVQTY